MLSRRKLIAALPCLVLTVAGTALPYTIKIHGASTIFAQETGEAKRR